MEQKTITNRKKGFYLILLLTFLQIIMIYFWFPTWDIEAGIFSDDSGVFIAGCFTVMATFAIYIYKTKVKWYEPIIDMLILGAGIWLGTIIAPVTHPDFPSAVKGYSMTIIIIILIGFYLLKLFDWKDKKKKERKINRQKNAS